VFHVEQGAKRENVLTSCPEDALSSSAFLAGLIAGAGLSVPMPAVEKLLDHAREMLRWNRSIRLTAITEPVEVAVKHILDSLLLLRFTPFPGRILDFGSGAGYPGIPLAVVLPESRFLLLESSGKKCAFLSHILRKLSLANAEVVQARLGTNRRLPIGTFEHIVTRATLPAGEAVAVLLPYVAKTGRILLMRGPGRGKGASRGKEEFSPQKEVRERTVRFELPLRMGLREIREIRTP
jgi:16S rRNA (guanine527-N7)-methyltransferase